MKQLKTVTAWRVLFYPKGAFILKIQQIPTDTLNEYANNPRNNEEAIEAVAESIKEFGFKVPLVIDKNNVIIAGHTRKKAAELLGLEEVPCIVADDLTPEQIKAYRLADNKTAELAQWDFEKLEKELAELTAFDVDMTAFGFDEAIFDTATAEEDNFDVEKELETIDVPITQEGDIWQLGRHRLICGDSTQKEVIMRLMNKQDASLLITDPPYNVGYEGGSKKRENIKNDNMGEEEFTTFLGKVFCNINNVLKEGGAFYIWHAPTEAKSFFEACEETGWNIRQCLVWVKNQFTFGRQDYQWQHENCLYGWKEGEAHYFIDSRTECTVFEDIVNIDKLKASELKELCKELMQQREHTTVIREDRPTASELHPTMKPIKLMARLIKNSSRKNEIVVDFFGGSGSTLIACEQLERTCYMCELEPKYCDVIIKRFEELTGEKAVKIA